MTSQGEQFLNTIFESGSLFDFRAKFFTCIIGTIISSALPVWLIVVLFENAMAFLYINFQLIRKLSGSELTFENVQPLDYRVTKQ